MQCSWARLEEEEEEEGEFRKNPSPCEGLGCLYKHMPFTTAIRQDYDKQLPDYKCNADRKLAGPLSDSILVTHLKLFSRQCTSAATGLPAPPLPLPLLLFVVIHSLLLRRLA